MEEMQKLMHGSEKRGGHASFASILVNRNTVECDRGDILSDHCAKRAKRNSLSLEGRIKLASISKKFHSKTSVISRNEFDESSGIPLCVNRNESTGLTLDLHREIPSLSKPSRLARTNGPTRDRERERENEIEREATTKSGLHGDEITRDG